MKNFRKSGGRGFASSIAAVLTVLALSFAIAAVLSFSSLQHAGLVSTESRKVFEVFQDSKPFFDASVTDALLDSAYQTCGCSASNASGLNAAITQLVTQYLANSSARLSFGPVFVNYSSLSTPSFSASSCNTSLTGTFIYDINANSTNARINTSISVSKTLGIQKNSSAVWINVSNSTTLVANVTVTCA